MKKRVLTAVLTAALVTGTCVATVSAKEEKTYTIGICQLVQHDALDAATKGFEDAITEKMGDSVKFDEQNAQGDSNTCSTIINSFVSEGTDLILAKGERKILFVITDGQPDNEYTAREMIKRCANSGIEVIGLGFGSANEYVLGKLFTHYRAIGTVANLKNALFELVRETLVA